MFSGWKETIKSQYGTTWLRALSMLSLMDEAFDHATNSIAGFIEFGF